MILEQITKDLVQATREQDPLVLKTIRFILSEIRYQEIDKQRKLTDEEVISVLQREVKKRDEAIGLMKRGQRFELVEEEEKKIDVIKKYLPAQISDDELAKIIEKTIQSLPNPQMGMVIGKVMQQARGRADGKKVADMVKAKLDNL